MSSYPSGTVTFLFTDIEGSTKLAQKHPEIWEKLRDRHHAILQSAVEAHNGYVFQIIGDAFCVAFHTASDGLSTALDAQRGLQLEDWGKTPIKARMGLHTGSAELVGSDYRGYLTMAKVQRVMSIANGGQILLSNTSAELLRNNLPIGVKIRDMKEHRLKGLPEPERVWQIVGPDLQQDFPPSSSLIEIPNNLPLQLTSFIGREKEINQIKKRLEKNRLVTLTGSGGVGKTRLSLQVASQLLNEYHNGVWLVELAPITDPFLVTQTACSVLKITPQGNTPALDVLIDYLREKKLLLIVDNCEHLIDACAQFCNALLRACSNIRILASSREALEIDGETAFRVPSLSIPASESELQVIEECEAVKLFIERANVVQPDFELTDLNAPAIAYVCSRLDGIALAIELAASRLKVLKVEQIASRLDDVFRLLTGGSRTALPRQQTLRALIDWSYNLLSDDERAVLRNLSIFSGGWTLTAAEAICDHKDILDILTHLVDKSLVGVNYEHNNEARYYMLETIRQYSREKMTESGEGSEYRDKHSFFFSQWVENLTSAYEDIHPEIWFDQMNMEIENLRSALDWSSTRYDDTAVQLLSHLQSFWMTQGYWEEVMERSRWFLKRSEGTLPRTSSCVSALRRIGTLSMYQGSFAEAQDWLGKSLQLGFDIDDKKGICSAYNEMGRLARSYPAISKTPLEWFEDSLDLARSIGDELLIAKTLIFLGETFENKDLEKARAYYQGSLDIVRKQNYTSMIFWPLGGLGTLALQEGNLKQARRFFEEGLESLRLGHFKEGSLIWILVNLVEVCLRMGDYDRALAFLIEAKNTAQELNSKLWEPTYAYIEAIYLIWVGHEYDLALQICRRSYQSLQVSNREVLLPFIFWALVEYLMSTRHLELGIMLIGNMQSEEYKFGKPMFPIYCDDVERNLAIARKYVAEPAIDSILVEGKSMSQEAALERVWKEL